MLANTLQLQVSFNNSLELLSKKEFRRHYVQSLFSPGELLKLFKKLLIVFPITEDEFLMPCLLRVTQESTSFAPSSSVPSLLFYFPHSPLLGVFCALVAYLYLKQSGSCSLMLVADLL